ncbi:O-antigen ligase family protein [Candidatus Uhrbacteria bacterium]|nr:O-antigen ligase family protein [Candidatus Uhrbacteria bacterium]
MWRFIGNWKLKIGNLLLFLLPLQTQWIFRAGQLRGQPWEYGTIGIFAVDVLVIGLALWEAGVAWRAPGSQGMLRLNGLGTVGWWIGALLLQILLSIIAAKDRSIAWIHTLWVAEAIALGWMVARSSVPRQIAGAFVAGGALQALLGLWQFFTQSTFASTLFGLAVHPTWQGGTSVIEVVGERWLRAYGGLPHPNILGGWMAVAIIIASFLLSTEGRPRIRLLLYCCIAVLSSGLAVSFSRSAWIAAAVGTVVVFLLSLRATISRHPGLASLPAGRYGIRSDSGHPASREKRDQAGMTTRLLLPLSIVFFSISAILLPYRSLLVTRLESTARLEQISINQRGQQYQQAWELVRSQSWIRSGGWVGVAGIGNYTRVVSDRHPDMPVWSIQPVHNVFALVAVELHRISLFWVALIVYYTFKKSLGITPLSSLRRHIKTALQDPRSTLSLALFVALLPLLFLDHYFWSLHGGLLLLGAVFGFISLGRIMDPTPS